MDGGDDLDRRALVDSWRAANYYYYELETTEAGLADNAECLDLPEALVPLAAELSATPSFRCTFDKLPTTFGMVELDRIVVSQRRVTQPFVEAQRARLDPRPDLEGLFRFCQPLERRDPPVTIRRLGGQRFAFASTSNDLRFLDAELLRPDQISRYDSVGPIGAVVGLVVGYGSNFLSVIRSDNRMLLHNGYHRACALRAAGFTHAPAVIQTVTRRDELELASTQAVIDNPAFFFRAKRPPVLKDFFDPRIRTVLQARRFEKLVEVSFEVRDCTATQAWSRTHPRKRRPGGRPDCSDRRRSPSNRTGGLARCCSRRRPRTPSTPRSQPCWCWACSGCSALGNTPARPGSAAGSRPSRG